MQKINSKEINENSKTNNNETNLQVNNILMNKSYLDKFNQELHIKTLKKKEELEKQREQFWYMSFSDYELNKLKNTFFEIINDEELSSFEDIDISFIDKKKFNWDISIKIPKLLKKYWSKWYIAKLNDILSKLNLIEPQIIDNVEVKWIYINISLSKNYLFESLKQIEKYWDKFWYSDINRWKTVVVDYSSPNTAKNLHAWHIRSTIIWHILSNLYFSTWNLVHRVNHINDWGGFWYLIEWYERWNSKITSYETKNEMLFEIYWTFRLGQKVSDSEESFNALSEENLNKLKYFYWDFFWYKEFNLLYKEFANRADNKFKNLENWKKHEVELWEKIVNWSLEDFDKFYKTLWINLDYVIWESFYADKWKNIVEDLSAKESNIVFYDENSANNDLKKLQEILKNKEVSEKEFKYLKQEILNDVWSYVVLLPNFERFVVLKKDKSTIYATRDLWAIFYRNNTFTPDRIVYEVGQEQAEHFDKLFKSAKTLGLNNLDFEHIYHWFYVDSENKKKLSSRDWASNVQKLISESVNYFKDKYKDNSRGFSSQEIDNIAYNLAIWSIIVNDLKKDKKNPVLLNSDVEKACIDFEESWGAYIIYTACRAKSILKKSSIKIPKIDDVKLNSLEEIEKTIILELNKYPFVLSEASKKDNPAILIEYIMKLSRSYNTFYNSCYVLWEEINHRLVITNSVVKILTNAMKVCNINIPEKI